MPEFTRIAVARDGTTLHFSRQIAELARLVELPAPSFGGKLLWKEGVIERWIIETKIPGRTDDLQAEEFVYEERYSD